MLHRLRPFAARLRRVPLEAVVWTGALAVLAGTDPSAPPLLDLCGFRILGLPFCPGCGLGHAVAHTLDGNLAAAFAAHPLGPFAACTLAGRSLHLVRESWRPSPSISSLSSPR